LSEISQIIPPFLLLGIGLNYQLAERELGFDADVRMEGWKEQACPRPLRARPRESKNLSLR